MTAIGHLAARQRPIHTVVYATAALVAFAANSVLCRVALSQSSIDPATFSSIRIATGAATLLLLLTFSTRSRVGTPRSWISPTMLFLYAVPFSFAYTQLTTGTGALILFGAVQVTMLAGAACAGERLRATQWVGVIIALLGLVYLVLPGLSAPPLASAALMALAGLSWGIYTLRGRGLGNPLAQTAINFARAMPFVILVSLVTLRNFHVTPRGALLAALSGSVTSGLGYAVWYAALRGLSGTRAAVLQLAVPILAAGGGVVFLLEAISLRLIVSTVLVVGGIALTVMTADKA